MMPPVDRVNGREPQGVVPLPHASDGLNFWGETGIIRVAGAVDAHTEPIFRQALEACESDPCIHALDLSGVDFFSAAGAGCFVARGWPDRPHVPIIASTCVRRVLSICDMEYLLDQHGWRHV